MLRDSLAELLDQRTPFGRLALTQVLATAGDTLLTVSLAGTLFFDISPHAAKGKVILYLALTMAPFAVIAPLLGPVIDRSRGARRAMIVVSAAGRAAVCYLMARDVHSLLLFPLAFVMLVLSKVYLVTKGAIVPLLTQRTPGRAQPPPATSAGAAQRAGVTVDRATGTGDTTEPVHYDELAALNAHLGLLSSLAALVASLPALAILKLNVPVPFTGAHITGGAAWVLRADIVVFLAMAWSGMRLPIGRSRGERAGRRGAAAAGAAGAAAAGDRRGAGTSGWEVTSSRLAALGGRHAVHPEVTLALSAMSLLRGVVGFLTFLLAFSLRRMDAASWWYGAVLAASLAGSVVGVLLVPRVRRLFGEQQMLTVSVWLVAVPAAVAAVVGGLAVQAALAFVLGFAAAAAKPAFDALVQRYVPTAEQGRAFARFETRLQLAWVVGSLIAVATSVPLAAGDVAIAVMAGVVAVSYATGRRALVYNRSGGRSVPDPPDG
jgi:hypothetical protein